MKQLGELVTPPMPVTVTGRLSDDGPEVSIVLDVIDERLQCREVAFTAIGKREIRRADLSNLSLEDTKDDFINKWCRPGSVASGAGGTFISSDGLTLSYSGPEEEETTGRAALRSYRRHKHGPDMLRRVAAVYAAADYAPTQAVADAFGVAHRTAGLYVRQARDAGLLPEPGRG